MSVCYSVMPKQKGIDPRPIVTSIPRYYDDGDGLEKGRALLRILYVCSMSASLPNAAVIQFVL